MSPLKVSLLATALFAAGDSALAFRQSEASLRTETADRKLVESIVQENAVVTSVPRRGVVAYLSHLGSRLLRWLTELLEPFGDYAHGIGRAIGGTVMVVFVLTAALLVYLAARILLRRRGRKRAPPSAPALPSAEHRVPAWDSARWRQELEERIGRSDVAGALEASWWWLARSIVGGRVKDSWTSGELLSSAAAGTRRGLAEPVRRLERMMYGGDRPSIEEVLDLVRKLESRIA